jgi:hypothetical protein
MDTLPTNRIAVKRFDRVERFLSHSLDRLDLARESRNGNVRSLLRAGRRQLLRAIWAYRKARR